MSETHGEINPPHYRQAGRSECIDVMETYFVEWLRTSEGQHMLERCGLSQLLIVRASGLLAPTILRVLAKFLMLGFCLGNAFKYRYRQGRKAGADPAVDAAKAAWYAKMGPHKADPMLCEDPRGYLR